MEAPPGRMTLEAVKGFEYRPAQREVEIRNGKGRPGGVAALGELV